MTDFIDCKCPNCQMTIRVYRHSNRNGVMVENGNGIHTCGRCIECVVPIYPPAEEGGEV